MKLVVVHAFDVRPEVELAPTAYAPPGHLYIVPQDMTFETMARTMHAAEKGRSEWIRRYENVLQGLKYWKEIALAGKETE